MFGFCQSDSSLLLEQLDYKYIETCADKDKLETILKVLRSGDEGTFPDLEEFAEKKLFTLNPKSHLLEKENKETLLRDLRGNDRDSVFNDIKNWSSRAEVNNNLDVVNYDELPPIRATLPETGSEEVKKDEHKTKGNKPAAPRSYDEWAKLDKKIQEDQVEIEQKVTSNKTKLNVEDPLSRKLKENIAYGDVDRETAALNEKNKGNEAFRSGDYGEALIYYKRSVALLSLAATLNNRAMTYIKLDKFEQAIKDCEQVLTCEPDNIKAYLRRGIANKSLNNFDKAQADFNKVLQLNPTNKRGKELLQEVTKLIGPSKSSNKKPGRRLLVEDVDEVSVEEPPPLTTNHHISDEQNTPLICTVTTEKNLSDAGKQMKTDCLSEQTPDVARTLMKMPSDVSAIKKEGNVLYKSGHYAKACEVYSDAINLLNSKNGCYNDSHSVLLSNRAMCKQKNGDLKGCISDCDYSLSIYSSVKAVLRKAVALEALEKYEEAYVYYELVYETDTQTNKMAVDGRNRLRSMLRNQHGNNWKIPEHLVKSRNILMQNLKDIRNGEYIIQDTNNKSIETQSVLEKKYEVENCAHKKGNDQPDVVSYKSNKDAGNSLFQQKKYIEAISKYAYCMKLPDCELSIYTNRALCFLKLQMNKEAIEDCSYVLSQQSEHVKALYRRALARKAMGMYKEALADLTTALKAEENNTAVKEEYTKTKNLFRSELRKIQAQNTKSASPPKGKPINIEVVSNEPTTVSPKKTTLSTKADTCPLKASAAPKIPKQVSASEFLKCWRELDSNGKTADYAQLLQNVLPEKLPEVLSNKLDEKMLKNIVATIHDQFTKRSNYKVGIKYLEYLALSDRFGLNMMFIKDKSNIQQTFASFESYLKVEHDPGLLSKLTFLRKSYKL